MRVPVLVDYEAAGTCEFGLAPASSGDGAELEVESLAGSEHGEGSLGVVAETPVPPFRSGAGWWDDTIGCQCYAQIKDTASR